jgi:hypothetical protein
MLDEEGDSDPREREAPLLAVADDPTLEHVELDVAAPGARELVRSSDRRYEARHPSLAIE